MGAKWGAVHTIIHQTVTELEAIDSDIVIVGRDVDRELIVDRLVRVGEMMYKAAGIVRRDGRT